MIHVNKGIAQVFNRVSLIVSFSLFVVINGPAFAQGEGDFTNKKPTTSELIKALKIEKQPMFKTRGLGKRGLDVTSTTTIKASAPKSVNLTVQFELGSTRLTSEARATLSQLGEAMVSEQLAMNIFKIIGHTDATGNDDYNYNLSVDRAHAVRQYLSRNFNIPKSRLASTGMGEDMLLDASNPASAKNRRVEVVNLGNK